MSTKLALDALKKYGVIEPVAAFNHAEWKRDYAAVIAALEAVQEPVAWRFHDGKMWCYVNHLTDLSKKHWGLKNEVFEPLFVTPQPVVQVEPVAHCFVKPLEPDDGARNKPAPGVVGQQMEDGIKAIAQRFGHTFWWAGEDGCPSEIKAPNGELLKARCKKCGQDNPQSKWCPTSQEPAPKATP